MTNHFNRKVFFFNQSKVIYPTFSQGKTAFVLFGCKAAYTFELQGELDFKYGDNVIVNFENPILASIMNNVNEINFEDVFVGD